MSTITIRTEPITSVTISPVFHPLSSDIMYACMYVCPVIYLSVYAYVVHTYIRMYLCTLCLTCLRAIYTMESQWTITNVWYSKLQSWLSAYKRLFCLLIHNTYSTYIIHTLHTYIYTYTYRSRKVTSAMTWTVKRRITIALYVWVSLWYYWGYGEESSRSCVRTRVCMCVCMCICVCMCMCMRMRDPQIVCSRYTIFNGNVNNSSMYECRSAWVYEWVYECMRVGW